MISAGKAGSQMARIVKQSISNQARNYGSILVPSMSTYKNINCSGKLNDKVAVVTASTSGIGYCIAEKLALEGGEVVVSSRYEVNVENALQDLSFMRINALGIVCHVGKQDHREHLIQETLAKHGKIDILVCNAATNPTAGGILDCTEGVWDKIFEINVKSVWQLIKETVPHMKENGGGSIVIVSSIAALSPIEMLGAYSVTKTALLGLNKVLAKELAQYNIRVNCVLPGLVKTKFSQVIFDSEEILEKFMKNVPMNRPGKAEEIANMVSFLASDESSYITGEDFVVAGGMQSRL